MRLNPILKLRSIPLASAILGTLCLTAGLLLERSSSTWLVRFVGQAGTSNPKILEKVRLVPAVLTLGGAEFLVFGCLSFFYLRRNRQVPELLECLEAKQQCMVLLLSLYLLIGLQALNFASVTLTKRILAGEEHIDADLVAADFGEDYAVLKAVEEQTPKNACILIRTREPIKYLLNYHLFPRRFFIYPDPQVGVAEIPSDWMQKHAIGWTLEIKDGDPSQFALRRREGSPGRTLQENPGDKL